jgi:hypothetical protein
MKRKRISDSEPTQLEKQCKLDTNLSREGLVAHFRSILDLSSLDSLEEISQRFDDIARHMLHEFYLVVRAEDKITEFEILELEFYLRREGIHEDPFTHGSEEQKVAGNW